jgi:hypothetical protein
MIFIHVDRRPAIGSSLPCVCRYLRSGRFKDTAAELGCPTCTGQPATPGHPSSKPRSTRVSRSSIQATSRPWATPNCSSLWRDRRNGGSVATLSDSAGPARHRRPASPCPAMLRAQVTGATIRAPRVDELHRPGAGARKRSSPNGQAPRGVVGCRHSRAKSDL